MGPFHISLFQVSCFSAGSPGDRAKTGKERCSYTSNGRWTPQALEGSTREKQGREAQVKRLDDATAALEAKSTALLNEIRQKVIA